MKPAADEHKSLNLLQNQPGCFDPPITGNPVDPELQPIEPFDNDEEPPSMEYEDGLVKGIVYYPVFFRSSRWNRVPIVFMAHGNHSRADPSYLGYKYFQIQLANIGIIAVSVDCNALNGRGGSVRDIEDRVDLIIDNIVYFQKLDRDPGNTFYEKIYFDNLGLVGHSRGGDAVVMLPTVASLSGVTIRSVLALAPTNFRYWFGRSTIGPDGYAFMTMLPAGDGDVSDNNGAQFYDRAIPGLYKSQIYAHFTNHNFFNHEWLSDDSLWTTPQPAVLQRAEHERILSAYGCALFRTSLLGHNLENFLAGYELPFGVPNQHIYLSFERDGAETVDNHQDGNSIDKNSLGQPTDQLHGMVADEFDFQQRGNFYNTSFYGESVGMVAKPGRQGRIFRSRLPGPQDLSEREIWIRAAEVTDGHSVPSGATGFELGVKDVNGTRAWVDTDDVGGLPRPYERNPGMIKTMLNTLIFAGECFKHEKNLDLKKVQAILIRCNRNDNRAFAIDDLQIV